MLTFYEKSNLIGYWVSRVETDRLLGKHYRRSWRLLKPKNLPTYDEFVEMKKTELSLSPNERSTSAFA